MNRKFIIGLLLFLSTMAQAQYGGELVLGGRFNYIGGGRIISPDGDKINTGYSLKVAPSLAYFIRNGIAIGVITGYEYMTDYRGYQHTGEVIPFVRYDMGGGKVRFFLQAESGCGWGSSKMKSGEKKRHFIWASVLKPGIWVRITDKVAAEATFSSLQYKRVKSKNPDTRETFTWDEWKFRWLDISCGVAVVFDF